MAPHSSTLAWKIPRTEEPGGLQSMGSVGHAAAAAAAKSIQSCPTLCNPIDGSPPGSPIPRILQARTLEWVGISFSKKVKSLSCVQLFATLWSIAHQAPLSMGFSRQEYWSGLPFPSPRDLPNPGIGPRSPALQADALTSEPPGKPITLAPFKTTGEVDRESSPKHMKYFQTTLTVINSLPGGNDICHTN